MTALYRLWCRTYQAAFRLAWPFIDLREPTLLSGPGAIQKLPEIIFSSGIDRVLLVTDTGLVKAGLVDPLVERMTRQGIAVDVYDGTVPNPTVDNVEAALSRYQAFSAKALVALGGGSAMDVAKAVGARVANPRKSVKSMRGVLKVRRPIPPLYAIPTTAGTGSEATLAAVVTDPSDKSKFAINDPVLVPAMAVLDPRLTVSLPPHVTAATGIDALTHAVEAYIGSSNTARTRRYAREAVRLVFGNLKRACADGSDIIARGHMQRAAYVAGLAFTRAYVGNVHAIAHTLGGFANVPHGLANAVVLPYVLDFYGDRAARRLSELAVEAGVADAASSVRENANRFVQAIRALNESVGIPVRFAPGTFLAEDLDAMVAHAMREANPLYPVPIIMDAAAFRSIYEKIQ
ncbi:MAG: iron-containing alcohol dehydrogenase [Candidatus Izemoplasmatales bacterium]